MEQIDPGWIGLGLFGLILMIVGVLDLVAWWRGWDNDPEH